MCYRLNIIRSRVPGQAVSESEGTATWQEIDLSSPRGGLMRSQQMLLVFALAVCGAVLAACSRATAPVPPGGLLQQTSAGDNGTAFRRLYSFTGKGGDGAEPFADLVDVDGVLYGTASEGGSSSACDDGCGTAFTVTAGGHERTIYSFGSYTGDGKRPYSALVAVGDTLYGTTQNGGSS